MLGGLRDIVWRSTWDRASFDVLRNMYISSCKDRGDQAPSFEDLPGSLPHRFSAVLSMVSEALICGLEGEESGGGLKSYMEKLRGELLKLYSDLLMEEREYRISLRPHRIEDLLGILAKKISYTYNGPYD